MHYSSDFLNTLNEATDLYNLISAYTELKPSSKNTYSGKCPLPGHKDKDPSFVLHASTNSWYCYGCKKGTNAIHFIQEMEGLTFYEAVDYLCELTGIQKPEDTCFKTTYDKHYKQQQMYLKKHNQISLDYLHNRGLTDQTIKEWGIGYNGERITFPFYNREQNILGFSLRYIVVPPEGRKYWHPNNSEWYQKSNYLYGIHKYSPRKSDYIFFTEGNLDEVLADQYGLPNVLCTLGTTFSDDYMAFVLKTKKIPVFVYDGDEAGRLGTEKACEKCEESGVTPYVVLLEPGMDLADTALTYQDKLYDHISNQMMPYSYYLIHKCIEEYHKGFYKFQAPYYAIFKENVHKLNAKDQDYARNFIKQGTGIDIY